jgi:molybdate transport system regulatory protein
MKPKSPDLAEVLGHASTDKRIDILRRIGDGGSISEAARRAGVSYKAAWQAIETLSNLAGTPLVEKAVGGSGGGGAVITSAGRRVLGAAAMLDKARADVMALLEPGPQGKHAGPGLAALALRTSMRNQFPCTVKTLRSTAGLVRIGLELPGGSLLGRLLYARITRESAQLLQLQPGLRVLALCKATAVRVALQIDQAESRNVVTGTVSRASRSRLGAEVALRLEGGVSLVGFCDPGQTLKAGQPAMASIEESGVVVAISG